MTSEKGINDGGLSGLIVIDVEWRVFEEVDMV
jgi:hypothetical protein